ncbi:DUF2298 domain-containing protein [Anaerocolumna xylanovorans]|uniref:Chlor_Arch_YYY domain-containing protein n=1 Tax=Anaerocolumna xylanovorans DSM 12503 TaxID=1121345 RepID=A0A1M7YCF4_9FIRM|nr:DUF2298 domain-containing protein [Anaerocolumna xylanovorans]SHO50320.1 Chlor_Arch_YYY domain-containing protein [Anaerocolumna xylanovorans DSM 12503]
MNSKHKIIFTSVLIIAVLVAGRFLLGKDFTSFFKWWGVLLLLGATFIPIAGIVFENFHDKGFLFSKTIGIAAAGYLMWLLSAIRLLKFSSFSCVLIMVLLIIANGFVLTRWKKKKLSLNRENIKSILIEELLFLVFFLLWTYIRGFKPEAHGTEKFMDYGFMAAMMRADYMPPKDMWFAGSTINYYYVGQFLATFLTKLSFVRANEGYNLMMMTLAALGFVLPYAIAYNVTLQYLKDKGSSGRWKAPFAGMLSGAGVSLAGNIHFVLFYWVVPGIRSFLGITGDFKNYWFPNSTRYIGYNPDTHDKTIHEFPSYSFILGDLHAHVLNIMLVLTVTAILFAWLLKRKKLMEEGYGADKKPKLLTEILNPHILLIGFLIGVFHTTNFWDYPIYFVVSGAIILFSNMVFYDFKIEAYGVTAIQGAAVLAISEITAMPFTLTFDQISTEVNLTQTHTPLYQLIVLWGLPAIIVLGLLTELIMLQRRRDREKEQVSFESTGKRCYTGIKGFFQNLTASELFIITLGLCAIGLVLIPEVIYVKDIYTGDYKRANTMFKLTYQAYILFGTSIGFIFAKFIHKPSFVWQKKFTVITLVLFLCTIWYSEVSVKAWYGNIFETKNYKGLDAIAFMGNSMPDDYETVKWLNQNITGTPVVLEANGDSYTDNERISMATGLPTVLGWYVHEWLWHGNVAVLNQRIEDVKTLYTTADLQEAKAIIKEYHIKYIYVGKLEQDKFPELNKDFIKSLGTIVLDYAERADKNYESFLIKVSE